MKLSGKVALLAVIALFCCLPSMCMELKGTLVEKLIWTGQHYEPKTEVPFSYYVSPGASGADNAVYVLYESNLSILHKLEELTEEKVIPEGLFLFIRPGRLSGPSGSRFMRAAEFDHNGEEFTNLVIEEIIPFAANDAGIGISTNPDKHFVHGTSSGGALAWYGLWYRNDYFRRGFLCSPTFSAMRGGEEPMVLVRKTEPRPIRVFITSGTIEPDYFFGDSFVAAYNAASALKYAGYDIRFEIFAKGEHGSHQNDQDFWDRMMRWVFEPEHVEKPASCLRLSQIIPNDSQWEETAMSAPERVTKIVKEGGSYQIRRGRLYFKSGLFGRRELLDVPGYVTSIALSSDLWRLYVTSRDSRNVYAFTLDSLGHPGGRYILAPIHEAYDIELVGCEDMCVSADDRVLLATQLGVQTSNSFGIVDGIIPLPDDKFAHRVWLADGFMYVMSEDGSVYQRKTTLSPHDGKSHCQPSRQTYGDNFDYSRPHIGTLFDSLDKGEVVLDF